MSLDFIVDLYKLSPAFAWTVAVIVGVLGAGWLILQMVKLMRGA